MKLTRRQFAFTAASAGVMGASRPFHSIPFLSEKRSLTEWYYADAIIMPRDTTPSSAFLDVTGESTDWMSIYNLSSQDSEAIVTRYFEDAPPRRYTDKIKASCATVVAVQGLPESEIPRGKLYGVRVQTTVPVVVQPVRAEHQIINPPVKPASGGNSFMSRMAHPGPLGKPETVWGFGNGFVEHHKNQDEGWEETERITVLNPDPKKMATVRITFSYPNAQEGHKFTVEPERVRTVNFMDMSFLQDNRAYGMIVRSDIPVIVEQVRRCFPNFNRNPLGGWVIPGYPLGDIDFQLPTHD